MKNMILKILDSMTSKKLETLENVILTPEDEIKKIDEAIAGHYRLWNNTTDHNIIDSCIRNIAVLNKQREIIQSELKAV